MTRSPTATLPASWMTHDATMRHYRGLVWYQRDFTADPKPGERQFLRFGAVNYRARIYLNGRSEEHTSELQSLMRISYAVFCLKKKNTHTILRNDYVTLRQSTTKTVHH